MVKLISPVAAKMRFIILLAFFVASSKCHANAQDIIDSLQNGNMKCHFQGSKAHNISKEHFSTKTSYFSVQNEETNEIKIEGK